MKSGPRLTVITPCYNSEAFVGRTIESVIEQSDPAWEMIVVDDGSTDQSAAIVSGYAAKDPRIRLCQQSNQGVCRARNNGAALASPSSRYLLFLDADDCLEPTMTQTLTGYLDSHAGVGLVYCRFSLIDAEDRVITNDPRLSHRAPRFLPAGLSIREIPDEEPETPFAALIAYFAAIPSSVVLRRTVFDQTTGWDGRAVRSPSSQDIDMALQVAIRAPVHFLPLQLVKYRRHDSAATSSFDYDQKGWIYRKWWTGDRLTRAQRATARRGILFDHRVAALIQAGIARRAFRRGEIGGGLIAAARLTRAAQRHALASGFCLLEAASSRAGAMAARQALSAPSEVQERSLGS